MANSPSFVDLALDLMALAGPVQARRMFGGHGLFHRGSMFGLLDDDELYLKTDEVTRQDFLDAGCAPWVYQSAQGPMETSYYRPPDDAHEDAEAMLPWARLAMGAAARAAAAKAARGRKKVARKSPAPRKGPRKKKARKVARKGRR